MKGADENPFFHDVRKSTPLLPLVLANTARAKQVELIDQLAGKAGMTRSAYMVQSALNPFSGTAKARCRNQVAEG